MSKYIYIRRDKLSTKYVQWAAERLKKGENPSDYEAFKQYDISTGGSGADSELQDKGWIGQTATVVSSIELLFPVARDWRCSVTQGFGPSNDLSLQAFYISLGYLGHNGIDIATTEPGWQRPGIIPIIACDDGVAYSILNDPTAGNYVYIIHKHGMSRVLHLASTVIISHPGSGMVITRGALLGYMGMMGAATGVHVHWDYKPYDADENNGYKGRIDPLGMKVVYQ